MRSGRSRPNFDNSLEEALSVQIQHKSDLFVPVCVTLCTVGPQIISSWQLRTSTKRISSSAKAFHAVQISRRSPLTLSEPGVLNVVPHAGARYQRRIDEDVALAQISTGRRRNADAIGLKEEGSAFVRLKLSETSGLVTGQAPSI